MENRNKELSKQYWLAGPTVMDSLLQEPCLSPGPTYQGILLHSICHQPDSWDHKPEKDLAAYSESSMWGDYHMREAALYFGRVSRSEKYYTFFGAYESH